MSPHEMQRTGNRVGVDNGMRSMVGRKRASLINHLVDDGQNKISHEARRNALAFSNYLETHARRLCGPTSEPERAAAQAILTKVHEGELHDGFKPWLDYVGAGRRLAHHLVSPSNSSLHHLLPLYRQLSLM
jgi:hypothetical protein